MKIKKNPKQNLENYSTVFTLLGLVLSLFITLIFMEQKTYASEKPNFYPKPSTIKMVDIPNMVNVVREKKQPKVEAPKDIKEPVETPTKPIDAIDPTKFKKTDNNVEIIEKPIAPTDDINILNDLNLSGMQRINCQFIINSNGEISPDIQTSKTHPELAKEITDVIKKLPKMIPAKQNGKAVNLIYMLPVRFSVE